MTRNASRVLRVNVADYKSAKRSEESFPARWQAYEREKQGWLRTHPEATHTEYEAAMRVIAKRCGV